MRLGATNGIGLPGGNQKNYKTTTINGHTVKSVNKTWHGTNIGWNVWVDGKLHFNGKLTRQEAIDAVMKKY